MRGAAAADRAALPRRELQRLQLVVLGGEIRPRHRQFLLTRPQGARERVDPHARYAHRVSELSLTGCRERRLHGSMETAVQRVAALAKHFDFSKKHAQLPPDDAPFRRRAPDHPARPARPAKLALRVCHIRARTRNGTRF